MPSASELAGNRPSAGEPSTRVPGAHEHPTGKPPERARLFIGGIIQGSKREMAIHPQSYRDQIAAVVHRYHPEIEIVDPVKLHPESVGYSQDLAIETFLALADQAAAADVLIAYVPEASMGTAVEIWRAYEAGKPVLVISPMANNWMLWATAAHIFPDIESFSAFVANGDLLSCLLRR